MQSAQGPQGWARCQALLGGVLLLPLVGTGCAGMSNTDAGVLGGAGIGAVVGGIVGHFCHNTAAGAAVGAVAGGVTGGVIGNQVDKKEQRQAILASQAQQAAQLQQIAEMAQSHVSDAVIISNIQQSGFYYPITGEQVNYLHQYGVSDQVIIALQQRTSPVVYVQQAQPVVYASPPAVVVAGPYYPPPPVAVGVGVHIH